MDRFGRWFLRTIPGVVLNYVWMYFVWWFLADKLSWVIIATQTQFSQKELIALMAAVTLGMSVFTDWAYFSFAFSTNALGVILHQVLKMLTTWLSFWILSFWMKFFSFVYPEGYSSIIMWFIAGSGLTWLRVYDIRSIVLRFCKPPEETNIP